MTHLLNSKNIFKLVLMYLLLNTHLSFASNMQNFLKSCGYGTGVGALVGIASLAFEDEPGSHMNNIARGASLGLYAGIAYGLYSTGEESTSPFVQVEPLLFDKKVEGLKVSVLNIQF